MMAVIASVVPVACGWLMLARLVPAPTLRAGIALVIGIAVPSITTTAILAVVSRADRFRVIDGALWACALSVAWWRSARRRAPSPRSVIVRDAPIRIRWVLWVALTFCAVALVRSSSGLHGAWDAWAIWNLRARFLLRATDWTQAFDVVVAFHPDYPLFLPLTVMRLWAWHGVETPWIPFLLGAVFEAAVLLVVIGATGVLNPPARITAGVLFIGSPWIREVPAQLADVPLSLFFAASFALAVLGLRNQMPALLVLAGMAASIAAWTKNEGLLFVLVAAAAWRMKGKHLLLWIAGALPGLITVSWVKLTLAAPSDLAQPLSVMFGKLLDPQRHAAVLQVLPGAAGWEWIPPLVVLLYLLIGTSHDKATRAGMAMIAMMLGGYYVVYVTTPHPQAWHVETSFGRLLAQVWPIAVLAVTAAGSEPPHRLPPVSACVPTR